MPTDAGFVDYADGYAERLEKCYSGAVYDVLRGLGLPDQILPRTIRPLDHSRPLAGGSTRLWRIATGR